ncbi:MAG: LamG domain-containing protein [Bacteroidaceae bacterium]|nr:LamG domain-containing protein [Bacteroidaceae bacterium]
MTIIQKTKLWWRMLLLLFVCLFGVTSGLWASIYDFSESDYTKVISSVSFDKPYYRVRLLFYDADSYDSFFCHNNAESGHKGPAVYVDGHYICSPDWELAWSGSKEDDAGDGSGKDCYEACSEYDSWWGDGYSKTIDGVTYTIKFWDPYCTSSSSTGGKRAVDMYVFISKMLVGTDHSIRVRGRWKTNSYSTNWREVVFSTESSNDRLKLGKLSSFGVGSPTGEMSAYKKMKISGNLVTENGPTVVGTYTGATTSGLDWSDNLTSYGSYNKGLATFSNLELGFDERDDFFNMQSKYVEYIITDQVTVDKAAMPEVKFYQWYIVKVPGFVYPTKFTKVVTDPWSKTVELEWEKNERDNRSKAGTWTVLRDDEVVANGLAYGRNSCTVPVPQYDKTYTYKLVFVPNDSPENTYINNLSLSRNVNLTRDWAFSNFKGEIEGDDAIKLTWNHPIIPDASSSNKYTMKLERMDNNANMPQWVEITNIDISSSSTEEGTYTDNMNLSANHSYSYRLSINLLETTITTGDFNPVTIGGSKITNFTASRGTYSNVVKLSWTVRQVGVDATEFALFRRPLGTIGDGGWRQLESFSGTSANYSYNDESTQAGNYNEYKIAIVSTDPVTKKQYFSDSRNTDGFTFSSGVVSGRITFGTGAGVEGAKVVLKQQNGDGEVSQNGGMHSLRFKGSKNTGLKLLTDTATIQKLFGGDFSIQMWVNPAFSEMSENNSSNVLLYVYDTFSLRLLCRNSGSTKDYQIQAWMSIYGNSYITIPGDQWSHVTLVHSATDKTTKVVVKRADGTMTKGFISHFNNLNVDWTAKALTANSMVIGNSTAMNANYNYRGYIDEFRFFTKALTDTEIERNYNHPLSGSEDGLAIYYPFDEGIALQTIAYDFSKTNGIPNGLHAESGKVAAISSTNVPNEDQLSLMDYTDVNGNYTVRGVPYSGEGTSYSIVPQKGMHNFLPTSQSRFVSTSSLVHNGVDFTDVSSFPVSGKVFYAGTDYPVEGVSFTVDGTPCTRGGQLITTDEEGAYTISVPIGDHYIQAVKNGHVFANNGRYPADPFLTDSCFTFVQEVKNLEFQDETLVNFTGRVVGGDIEGSKPLGFGLSENNIGITELVLTPINTVPRMNVVKQVTETAYSYETNQDTVFIASKTDKIRSKSWRGAKDADCRKLFIRTDSLTGEFSAMIPPIQYKVSSMSVLSNDSIDFGELTIVDLSDPLTESSDTLTHDGTSDTYTYNVKLKQTYHNPKPTFIVWQDGREDGSFGIDSYKFKDAVNQSVINNIYTVENDGSVTYNYGVSGHHAPLFLQGGSYTFFIKAYELYENYDADAHNPKTSNVPLKNVIVTIDNALSDDQPVWMVTGEVYIDGEKYQAHEGDVVELKSNELKLDSLGRGVYTWHGGLPNVSSPFTRTISMSYDINGYHYTWENPWPNNAMEGILMGDLSTGNNFITSGPDKLVMILRDPPGTGSSAEWTTGTATSVTKLENDTWSDSAESGFTSHLGHTEDFITGSGTVTVANTTLVASSCKIEDKDDLTFHVTEENEGEKGETIETTISVEETVATSGEPDFVGADGDVFVGQATNIIFGNARHVGFITDGANFEIGLRNVISTSLDFGTTFSYTQSYIENTLFPNFELMRENLLTTTTQDSINAFQPSNGVGVHDLGKNAGNLYLTTLKPDDDHYGESGYYTVIIPRGEKVMPDNLTELEQTLWAIANKEAVTDSIRWINSQIKNWKYYLAMNEKEKVRAYELREKNVTDSLEYVNYSFDGGASRSYSWEKDSTNTSSWEWSVSAGVLAANRLGFDIHGTGVDWELEVTATGGRHEAKDTINAYTTSFAYTLAEEGSDAISVDVYRYGAFSPIFRTRGGQTSNPYEGKVVTKYYKPGTTIMEETMQIEVPQIDVDVPIVSDIPTGSAANYTLRLGNASEIGEDVAYRIFVLDETNPDGAQLSIDGKVLTEGRLIKVPGNQTLTKILQLRQTDTSILNYEGNTDPEHELYGKGIGIVFASDSQPEDIADTIFIKAYYVPSSSDVALRLSNTTMNTQTGTDLTLTFSGFDRNYHNLKAFRLQYKQQGATDWTQLHEFVLNNADLEENDENKELLPASGASINYTLPMASFPDGNYLFRVVSAATYGLGEVYKYSDEIALIKDTKRPTPMGQPEPADGVLDIGDDVSVTFNEPIQKGELTMESNFVITGVLNGAKIAHETALSMQATETTAETEAAINLAGKDFSFDMWVNVNSEGTILSHGKASNKLIVGTDNDGKLVVEIGGTTYTSSNSVPRNKWAFLTICYHAGNNCGNLSATVATDDEETSLFNFQMVVPYAGNGPLSVGKNIRGAIHELLLWDEAHDLATALMNRSVTKSPSTRHLIGYWKMDEGEGTSIRDYARNHNMRMPNETWYMNNVNKAVSFDGNKYMRLYAADSPYSLNDDYAVELWMRCGNQNDSVQLLQAGQVGLWLNAAGRLQLSGKGAGIRGAESVIDINSPVLTDNAWHHVALNVLRQGAAAVYVDGKRVLTTSSTNVEHISTDYIYLGAHRAVEIGPGGHETGIVDIDRLFTGQIDELRVWDATLNGDKLTGDRKIRLTGREDGLVAYYPFETKMLDDYNQVVTTGIDYDLVHGNDAIHNATMLNLDGSTQQGPAYSDEAPALRTKPTETNVSYTYVASNEKIVIEIDEDPATIEGCTLNFTVRSVRDENDNYSVPATWSAFVNRKELIWQDDDLNIEQQVKNGSNVIATIVNKGGKQQMWTLDGMPSWLTASSDYGTTNPRSETTVTFAVSPATPIGKYEETIYLKGNDGIETPLTIHVKVTGNVPDWAVNPKDFENSLNVIGRVEIEGTPMDDEDDIVAAFIDEECRGVAHPVYKERYDGSFITMDIYGNAKDSLKVVTFRAYDASTGTLYPVVTPSDTITFAPLSLIGKYDDPVVLTVADLIEQVTELKAGWNWLSFYVKTADMTVPAIFGKIADDVKHVKSQGDGFSSFDNEKNSWSGELTSALSNTQMYAVQMKADRQLRIVGQRVDPENTVVSVGEGWNWIGYYGRQVASVSDALAGMQPVNGEILKGQSGVSYFDIYEWAGSLSMMEPGLGYILKSTADREFSYPAATVAAVKEMVMDFANAADADNHSTFMPVNYRKYANNAIMAVKIVAGRKILGNTELGVFADDECRAAALTNDEGIAYLTIPGDDVTTLTFKVALGDQIIEAKTTVNYEVDGVFGTPQHPMIVDLGEMTGIWEIAGDDEDVSVYDLQGRKVSLRDGSRKLNRGVYIVNGQKKAVK